MDEFVRIRIIKLLIQLKKDLLEVINLPITPKKFEVFFKRYNEYLKETKEITSQTDYVQQFDMIHSKVEGEREQNLSLLIVDIGRLKAYLEFTIDNIIKERDKYKTNAKNLESENKELRKKVAEYEGQIKRVESSR